MLVLSRKLGQSFQVGAESGDDREDRPQLGADRDRGPGRRDGLSRGDRPLRLNIPPRSGSWSGRGRIDRPACWSSGDRHVYVRSSA